MKNQYFASLNISICLEAEQECGVVIQVLNETLLPKGPCDWTTGFLQQSKSFVSIYSFVCLFCCFTSQVNSYGHGRTVSLPNHTFSWASLNKQLTSTLCTYFGL